MHHLVVATGCKKRGLMGFNAMGCKGTYGDRHGTVKGCENDKALVRSHSKGVDHIERKVCYRAV